MTALPNPFISESAPVLIAAQNSAEGDPAVTLDCAGADTSSDGSVESRHAVVSSPAGSDWPTVMMADFDRTGNREVGLAPDPSDAHRFVLDVDAFELAIAPAPLFLQRDYFDGDWEVMR